MKNIFRFAALAATSIFCTINSHAQMPYNVTTATEPYVALTNATSLNNGTVWSDETDFTLPLGFNFSMGGGAAVNQLVLLQSNLMLTGSTGTQSGFAMLGTSLQDRNFNGGSAVSPVQYVVSGAAGSRIFKLEFRNAGFYNEQELYQTSNDSVNLQVWFYENNKSVEFRFGPSSVTHFADYFDEKIPLGYIRDLNMSMFTFQKFYSLSGNPASPGIDSVANLENPIGFTSYPAAGTVYRFTPKGSPTGIGKVQQVTLGRIYPVPATDILHVDSKAERYEILSLTGNVVLSGTLLHGVKDIALQDLNAGMYLIRLSNDRQETDVKKFVKQ